MTDQFELHKQNTQVYGTKWPPEYRGRGKKKKPNSTSEESGVSIRQTQVILQLSGLVTHGFLRQSRTNLSCVLPQHSYVVFSLASSTPSTVILNEWVFFIFRLDD